MNKIEITVKRTVVNSVLNDIFITALEGGSNYWYSLSDEACNILDKYRVYEHEGKQIQFCFSERLLPAIEAGEEIPIHDYEEPENKKPLGFLSLKGVKDGIEKMIADGRSEVDVLFNEDADYDAADADVIFQYCVMGEIVFG